MTVSKEYNLTTYLLYTFVFSLLFLETSLVVDHLVGGLFGSFFAIACFFISAQYAGKHAQAPKVVTLTGIVSILAFFTLGNLFPPRMSILAGMGTPIAVAILWSIYTIVFEDKYPILWGKKVASKHLKTLVLSTFVLFLLGGVIWVLVLYFETITHFLDSHPWIVALIVPVITLLGGFLIGRRKKEGQ